MDGVSLGVLGGGEEGDLRAGQRWLLSVFVTLTRMAAEGKALADEFKCRFLETSAKTNTNVEQAFFEVVRAIRRYNREMQGGPAAGSGLSHNSGGMGKMDMADDDAQAGCCSKCVLM